MTMKGPYGLVGSTAPFFNCYAYADSFRGTSNIILEKHPPILFLCVQKNLVGCVQQICIVSYYNETWGSQLWLNASGCRLAGDPHFCPLLSLPQLFLFSLPWLEQEVENWAEVDVWKREEWWARVWHFPHFFFHYVLFFQPKEWEEKSLMHHQIRGSRICCLRHREVLGQPW